MDEMKHAIRVKEYLVANKKSNAYLNSEKIFISYSSLLNLVKIFSRTSGNGSWVEQLAIRDGKIDYASKFQDRYSWKEALKDISHSVILGQLI